MVKAVSERIQVADPVVTRKKFERELQKFRDLESTHNERGIFCYRAEFPEMHFLFVGVKLDPAPVLFSIKVDFTNYDAEPLSVRVLEPFSGQVYQSREQIKVKFEQRNQGGVDILQGVGPLKPFFCIPGIYEYHSHHFHTGDSWYRYRNEGHGTLSTILDVLYFYSIRRVRNYTYTIQTPSIDFIQVKDKPVVATKPTTPPTNTE